MANESAIFITKQPSVKEAFRFNSEADIPEFLRNSIHISDDGIITLDSAEGAEAEVAEREKIIGKVIAYEKSDKTESGYNAWVMDDESRIIEKDGVIYNKPTPTLALPIGQEGAETPLFLEGADITKNEDGSFSIKTDWGVSQGREGEAYWVRYGMREDGTPDANILTKSEKSFEQYFLCDSEGNIISSLKDFDFAYTEALKEQPNLNVGDFVQTFSSQISEIAKTAQSVLNRIEQTMDDVSMQDYDEVFNRRLMFYSDDERLAVAEYLEANPDGLHHVDVSSDEMRRLMIIQYQDLIDENEELVGIGAVPATALEAIRTISQAIREDPSLDFNELLSQRSLAQQFAVVQYVHGNAFFSEEYNNLPDHEKLQFGYENIPYTLISKQELDSYNIDTSSILKKALNQIKEKQRETEEQEHIIENEETKGNNMEDTKYNDVKEILDSIDETMDNVSMQDYDAEFNKRLMERPIEERLAVAEFLEKYPDGLHKVNVTSDEIRQEMSETKEHTDNTRNVHEMSTDELAKEYAKLATNFFVHHIGTDEDKKRIDEIDSRINEYGASDGGYGKKDFARLVDKYTNGISLIKLHELKAHYEDADQNKAAQHIGKNLTKRYDEPVLENENILDDLAAIEIEPIKTEHIEISDSIQDVQEANKKAEPDLASIREANKAFLYNYDKDENASEKEEKKSFADKLKGAFGKVADGVKGFTSKLVTEAMRPTKEQLSAVQDKVDSVAEQSNKQIHLSRRQIMAEAKEAIAEAKQQIMAEAKEQVRIAKEEMRKETDEKIRQATEQMKAEAQKLVSTAKEQIMASVSAVAVKVKQLADKVGLLSVSLEEQQSRINELVSQNAAAKRELAEKTGTKDEGYSFNGPINMKSIVDLQMNLLDIKDRLKEVEMAQAHEAEAKSVLEKFEKNVNIKNNTFESVMLNGGDTIKDVTGAYKSTILSVDPVKNELFKVTEHGEREYISDKNLELVMQGGNTVIDNDSIPTTAIIPIKSADENGKETIIGAVQLVDYNKFNEEQVVNDVSMVTDLITSKIEEEYQKAVLTKDPLTNLYNKEGIATVLESTVYDDVQNKVPVAAIKIAIDKDGGRREDAIKHVAELLQETNKNPDVILTPSRIDENNFVVLVEGQRGDIPKEIENEAYKYANKMCELVATTPLKDENGSMSLVTVSAGVSLVEEDMFINKSRDQMSEVFNNVTDKVITERCSEAIKDGGSKAIASYDITSPVITEIGDNYTFSMDKAIEDFTSPLLGTNYQELASMNLLVDTEKEIVATLEVVGTPVVQFNGVVYNDPQNYPEELVNNLKTHKDFNEYDIKILEEPTLNLKIGVYTADSPNSPVSVQEFEWKPSEFNGNMSTLRDAVKDKIKAVSKDVANDYERSISNEKDSRENTSLDTRNQQNKDDNVRS